MVIYGVGNKLLKEATIDNISCANCNHKSSVVSVYQRYFDLFWIPTFPLGKSIVLVCSNCNNAVKEKDFPEDFKQHAKQLKSSLSTPKYMFSGLMIMLALISYIAFGNYTDAQMEEGYLSDPQKGDVYAMFDEEEPTEYKYYFLKIAGIKGDSILFKANEYGYDGLTDEIFPEDGFYNIEFPYHKNDVVILYDSGKIKAIYRDYKASSGFNQTMKFDPLLMDESY